MKKRTHRGQGFLEQRPFEKSQSWEERAENLTAEIIKKVRGALGGGLFLTVNKLLSRRGEERSAVKAPLTGKARVS